MRGFISISLVIAIIVVAGVGAFVYQRFFSGQFSLPRGKTQVIEVTITPTPVPKTPEISASMSPSPLSSNNVSVSPSVEAPPSTEPTAVVREIFETDGTRHSIALDEILSGGPPKDGIPSIDNPKFLSVEEAGYLNDSDPGIGIVVKGEARFYPYRVMVWHELANDEIQGEPILVTYCPLCATGIVFERRVSGKTVEFGVSGKLWRSNLLMYDRQANETQESLWSQVLGEAVVGPQTAARLTILPSDIVRWGKWKAAHPDTKALSTETGSARNYSRDPYIDYYTSESVSFGATFRDTRLHPKALIYGIEVNGVYKAYDLEALKKIATFTDTVAGKSVAVVYVDDADSVSFTLVDGDSRTPLSNIPSFWFSWLAVHSETELYK